MTDPVFDICAEDHLPILLIRVTQLWRQRMDADLADHGLSQAKWRTLAILAMFPDGLIQSELAEELGIEGPSLVAMIDRLSKDDWVERIPCGTDRRCKVIRLTQRAWPMIDEIRISSEKIYNHIFSAVDPGQIKIVEDFLIHVRERLFEDLPAKKRHRHVRKGVHGQEIAAAEKA